MRKKLSSVATGVVVALGLGLGAAAPASAATGVLGYYSTMAECQAALAATPGAVSCQQIQEDGSSRVQYLLIDSHFQG
ncbi:hypothetical protein [Streptomyces sp. YU58]|uniref:hypothetical protein n=1 Tax=Streptomyces sp. SX92 TaxID=3158972 RepID=UPI0027BA02B3|nr:hypothetical protein [Streptomyces coralus]WLW55065.1 hypothetical protein QU709_28645 [Streptomyces coralus]